MVAYYLDYETGQIIERCVLSIGKRIVKINNWASTPIKDFRGEWFQYKSKAKEVGLLYFDLLREKEKGRILRFYASQIKHRNYKKEKVAIEFGVYRKCLRAEMKKINQSIIRLLQSYYTN